MIMTENETLKSKAGGSLLVLSLIMATASPFAYADLPQNTRVSRVPRHPGEPIYRDRDNNPPGPRGGPGTHWGNRPGLQGGPGASRDIRRGGPQWAAHHPEAVKRLDTNGDGRVSPEEFRQAQQVWQEKRADRLKKIDQNGDGKLEPAERQAARQQWLANHPKAAKKMDLNGDGKVDQADRQQFREQRRKRLEDWRQKANARGDGKVEPQERRLMREKWRAAHSQNAVQKDVGSPVAAASAPANTNS